MSAEIGPPAVDALVLLRLCVRPRFDVRMCPLPVFLAQVVNSYTRGDADRSNQHIYGHWMDSQANVSDDSRIGPSVT